MVVEERSHAKKNSGQIPSPCGLSYYATKTSSISGL
jgi:hypothetical protein